MTSRFRIFVGLAALAAGLLTSPVRAGYVFTNFDLPGSAFGTTVANGINNNGAAVGFASAPNGNFINFIRNPNGSFTTLNVGGDTAAMSFGINSANTVVGVTGNGMAFVLNSGSSTPTLLPPPNPGNTANSMAFGINDHGLIVGTYTDSTNVPNTAPGFLFNPTGSKYTLFNPTTTNPINTPNATNAQGINNNGLVIGFFANVNTPNVQQGFLFNSNTGVTTPLPNPSTPRIMQQGLQLVQFLGLNDNGTAVGYYQTVPGNQFGFLFDLATQTYTFLDDPNAAPFNGVQQTQITGINNAGEISGFYTDANGLHGFVAFPLATTIPEPSTLLLIGTGLLGLLAYRRRRRSAVE